MAVEFWTMGAGVPGTVERQAQRAEAAGWDGMAVVDSQNLTGDCYIALALAAKATSTIGLGTAVTNPYTRHAAVTASAIATVQAESAGRAVLGIGRGDSALAHIGLAPAPVPFFEDYVRRLQGYLRGEDVEADDAPTVGVAPATDLRLAGRPESSRLRWIGANLPKVPVDVYGSGPRVLAVGARLAERVTLAVGASPERVRWGLGVIDAAAGEAGRARPSIGACVNLVVHDDASEALRLASGGLASFARFSVMHGSATGPVEEADQRVLTSLHARYDMNLHTMAAGPQTQTLTEDFAARYAVLGPPEHCISRLRALVALGIERFMIIGPSLDADRQEASAARKRLEAEVLPALR